MTDKIYKDDAGVIIYLTSGVDDLLQSEGFDLYAIAEDPIGGMHSFECDFYPVSELCGETTEIYPGFIKGSADLGSAGIWTLQLRAVKGSTVFYGNTASLLIYDNLVTGSE